METESNETSTPQVAAELFEKYAPLMFKAALKETQNDEDAKDAMQNVFTRLVQNWPLRSVMKNPKAFLHRAARNEARNLVRLQRPRKQKEVDMDSMEIPAPQADSRRDDRVACVRAALARMKPAFVDILHLFYNEEYDCSEIAAIQGKRRGTVLVQLVRARAKLAQLIALEENGQ
jgi:RNA polymerase sigma factor (sigma-70 family)